jgi:hypothetical protein
MIDFQNGGAHACTDSAATCWNKDSHFGTTAARDDLIANSRPALESDSASVIRSKQASLTISQQIRYTAYLGGNYRKSKRACLHY